MHLEKKKPVAYKTSRSRDVMSNRVFAENVSRAGLDGKVPPRELEPANIPSGLSLCRRDPFTPLPWLAYLPAQHGEVGSVHGAVQPAEGGGAANQLHAGLRGLKTASRMTTTARQAG